MAILPSVAILFSVIIPFLGDHTLLGDHTPFGDNILLRGNPLLDGSTPVDGKAISHGSWHCLRGKIASKFPECSPASTTHTTQRKTISVLTVKKEQSQYIFFDPYLENPIVALFLKALSMTFLTVDPVSGGFGSLVDESLANDKLDKSLSREKAKYALCQSPAALTSPCLITDYIDHQTRVQPDAPAVQFESEKAVTYADLGRLSRRSAHVISAPKNTIVPICMDVSADLIATIIAILSLGAAYVILDPKGPTDRNNRIIQSCKADNVVVDEGYASFYPHSIVLRTALSQTTPKDINDQQAIDVSASDPAYLIYTSGTTGAPKGVIHTHAAASHGINALSLSGNSRTLLFYNPVFSAAQRNILATLSNGACLCLASREKLAVSLSEVVRDMQVDSIGLTPSAPSLLSPATVPQCLKQITTVGEPLSQSAVDDWAERVNLRVSYGLSECAQLNFSRRICIGDNPRCIGSPDDTTQAFILEPGHLTPLGAEEPGELCLAGPQVAEGYHNDSKATAEHFIDNVLGYRKIYRTGDSAVMHSDGNFEILGRLDNQVKIHGQRVEPEEVTAVLAKSRFVTGMAVIGADVKGKTSLVAVVVPKESAKWSTIVQTLRQQAQASLPSYMVPSFWMQVERLPVNANGKLDFAKIRHRVQSVGVEEMLFQSRDDKNISDHDWTSSELANRNAWAKVLRLQPSDITQSSSFIALGGSSLDAIQVVRQLRSWGFEVDLGDMLRAEKLSAIKSKRLEDDFDGTMKTHHPPRLSLVNDAELREELDKDTGVVDAYSITPLQTSLLASTLQGSPEYLYQRTYDVRHLDIVKLRLAFQVAFSDSEILRTTYTHSNNGIVQVIRKDLGIPWQNTTMELATFKSQDKEQGFAFDEPGVRFTVLQKQLLVVSMHHSIFDYWSHSFLYEDVAKLYLGIERIQRPPFRRFVYFLQQLDPKPAKAYWKSYLEHSEPSILNHAPSTRFNQGTKHISVNVRETMRALGVTSGAFLYTAWAVILARHTGNSQPVFATTIAGRELPIHDIHLLDGPTLTVIPQRVSVRPGSSVAQAVRDTQNSFFETLKHSQHGMRESLTASNQQNRPLFDTLVNILVKDNGGAKVAEEVFLAHGPKPIWRTEFTSLEIEENLDGFTFQLASPMSERQIDFILEQMVTTVNGMLERFDAPIQSLNTVGRDEQQWLTSSPRLAEGTPQTLHGRFETMAERHPDNIALQWQNRKSYTYRQLEVSANRIAFFLTEKHVRAGSIVPILFEKSPIMIITIIAILKAGAAYVPFSPDNPVDRNRFIIHETKADLVLTDDVHEKYFPNNEVTSMSLDTIDLSALPAQKPERPVSPDQLAYIMYTSGSTGQPKGVMIKHKSAAAAINSIIAFEGRENSHFRTLQFSNYVFDVSVYDIFVPLGCGHTLCMAPTDRLLSELATVINEMAVSHCFLTPTVVRLLNPKFVPSLQVLTVGGESVGADIVEAWSEDRTLILAYGPTETSILVTMKFASGDMNPRILGKPLPTAEAFIVEPDGLRLLPWGATGEICFQGPQLGDGYLEKPKQTADAFLKGDVGDGSRTYRTGDLGRWLPTSELEYLGRKDNQVKINGYRIELGEVEKVMMKASYIRDVAVVVDDQKTQPQLVAFVVFSQPGLSNSSFLMDFPEQLEDVKLSLKRLAHYMIPKFVFPLDSMPTLPSEKTDRKALKAMASSLNAVQLSQYALESPKSESIVETPETTEQKVLQEAWAQVLGIEASRFGLEADFLSLGGDSISAISLASHLRRHGYMLSVGEALGSTNLRTMATCVRELGVQDAGGQQIFEPPPQVLVALESCDLQRASYEYIYPCPPGQAHFLSQGAQEKQYWVVMIIRKFADSTVVDTWIPAVKQLVQVNDILRTTFIKGEDKWFGAVLTDSTPVISTENVANLEERARILEEVWQSRFKTGQPFLRHTILRMSDGTCEIVIKMDHGLYDGTLLRVFDDQFRAFLWGQPLPEFTPFQQFATHIWSGDKQRSLEFWTKPDQRPTGFQYPAISEPTITASQVLPINLPVDAYASSIGQTPSVVFQAAFQIWLALRSGSVDVSYDYLYTGRNVDLPDPQSINGPCASFLPIRSRIHSEQSVKDFLSATNTFFWRATENGNVSLQEIYRACNLSTDQAANTALFLFQPFEPPKNEGMDEMRWVVMAKSEVKMPQPYGIVCEVAKTMTGYKLKFAYDERAFDKNEARDAMRELLDILKHLIEVESTEIRVGALLSALSKRGLELTGTSRVQVRSVSQVTGSE